MFPGKKWNFKNRFTAKIGGCGCGPKSTDVVQPKPISKNSDREPSDSPSSSAVSGGGTSDSSSSQIRTENHDSFRKIEDSHAVAKDSDDPYNDFRQSMLQMIIEKKIYSGNELEYLLRCFLELNSPHHHEVIVRAFTEICNGGGGERFPPLGPLEN